MARCRDLTLLDVIQAVREVTEDDREVVAAVVHLITSGQVRLCDDAISAIKDLSTRSDVAA